MSLRGNSNRKVFIYLSFLSVALLPCCSEQWLKRFSYIIASIKIHVSHTPSIVAFLRLAKTEKEGIEIECDAFRRLNISYGYVVHTQIDHYYKESGHLNVSGIFLCCDLKYTTMDTSENVK